MDFKAKAKIPRCTSGSGGAVAAGVVVVLSVVASLVMRVRIHARTHSISNLACAVQKRSGKLTVVPEALAVAVALAVVVVAIGIGVGVEILVRG